MAHRISLNVTKSFWLQCTQSRPLSLYKLHNAHQVSRYPINTQVVPGGLICFNNVYSVSLVRHNSQHRVVLLPEVPPDNPSTNPILKIFNEKADEIATEETKKVSNLPDYNKITDRDCYFGLGKALLEFEAALAQLEQKCEDGITDIDTLFVPFEHALCQFQSVWNSVSLLNLATDKFDRDRTAIISARAEACFSSRFNSKTIHANLKKIKEGIDEGKIKVDDQQKRIVDRYLSQLHLSGFDLSEKKYRELSETWIKRVHQHRREYQWRIMTATERFRYQIKDPNIVRDFPVDVLKTMAMDGTQPTKGPWTVTLHPYIYKQVMAYAPERNLRYRVYQAYVTRGTAAIDIYTQCQAQVRDLRTNRKNVALTLGYENFAEVTLSDKMATNPENVKLMISSLLGKAKEYQEVELEQLQAYAASRGFDEDIEVYDVEFLKRKHRRTLLGMSDEDFRDYLPLPKVLTGIFRLCESLFDLRFEEIGGVNDASEDMKTAMGNKRWAPEIKLYRVIDVGKGGNNTVLGQFFLDPYVRDDKGYAGGDKGWYIPIRPHSSIAGCEALGAMILSLPIPNYGKPSLLNIAETEEILRNFGNLLAHVCSTKISKWSELSGRTGLEYDVLDLAGMFMIHWLYVPETLRILSGHWSTNEPLPNSAIDALCTTAGKQHMAGYSLCNELFEASYDLTFYTEDYEKDPFQELVVRMRSEYLLLPPAGGDAFPLYMLDMMYGVSELMGPSCTYSKTWSKMLAADAFSAVQEAIQINGTQSEQNQTNILDNEAVKRVTRRFRSTLLDKGSTEPASEMFRQFRGRDPSHEALLFSLGLQSTRSPKIKSQKEAIA